MAGDTRYDGASHYLHSWSKRCLDIVAGLVLLLPAAVLAGCIGLIILVREGRPVLFVQNRVGRDGELFKMPKLRTLRTDVGPYVPAAEEAIASYATSTGRLLRRHKLDELPQVFTVLAGRMSLVGPRPELPDIVATYDALQRKRLLMKPGLTGLWQVMANHKVPIHTNLKYDLYYLRKASLWLDIRVLIATIPFVLRPGRYDS